MPDVIITIKPFQPLEVDLEGFHGKGCSDVADLFANLGNTVERKQKPEHSETAAGATVRQPARVQVGRGPGRRR